MQNFDKSNLKFSSPKDVGLLEPNQRIKVLSDYSVTVDVDPNVPPKRYYRSGLEMVRMANVYMDEGSLENAYVLYLKFMTLFLEKIRKHPDFNTVPSDMKVQNNTKLREVLPKAEHLKAELLKKYTLEYNAYLQDQKKKDLRERELLKRKLAEAKSREQRDAKELEDRVRDGRAWQRTPVAISDLSIDDVMYPDDDGAIVKPPKAKPDVPTRLHEPIKDEKPLPVAKPDKLDIPTTPSVDRSLKPSSLLSPSVELKTDGSLRNIIVPGKLMKNFLNLAQKNTFNSIETCGVLAGKLERDRLIITHVIVSKQTGTSDTCVTMNEEEIFEFQDQHNLITLGWIHTHPTQTAFLSSIDVHTQCSYQIMMPEAIAIVCAPKYQETGFYVLTLYGLELVSQCRQTGFHPHPREPPLFVTADHIRIDDSVFIEMVDFR